MEGDRRIDQDAAPFDVVMGKTVVNDVIVQLLRRRSPPDRDPGEEDALHAYLLPSVPRKRDLRVSRLRQIAVVRPGLGELDSESVCTLLLGA